MATAATHVTMSRTLFIGCSLRKVVWSSAEGLLMVRHAAHSLHRTRFGEWPQPQEDHPGYGRARSVWRFEKAWHEAHGAPSTKTDRDATSARHLADVAK